MVSQYCSALSCVLRRSTWSSCSIGHNWTLCLLRFGSPAIAQPCTLDSISWVADMHEACRVRILPPLLAGKIRGGGGKAGEEAEKAIEAIRDAKKLLGEGPRFREVDASAINSGNTSSRCVPQMHILHRCGSA